MDGFAAVDFGFAREVLQRGIAALYFVAFVSTLNQFRALLGEHGLLPAPELLAWADAISILSTFNSVSKSWAIVSFSEGEKETPLVCSPSRRVVSIISM